jgi:hypothetical protein
MKIIGVDPGGTTGVAVWETTTKRVERHYETTNALTVADLIQRYSSAATPRNKPVVVIEDFIGGGATDVNAAHTLKLVGFFEGFSRWLGLVVVVQAPQIRKSALVAARQHLGHGHHYTDALAHALAYDRIRLKRIRAEEAGKVKRIDG